MKELLLRPQLLGKKLNVIYQQGIYRSIKLHKLLHRASLQRFDHILDKPLRVQIHHSSVRFSVQYLVANRLHKMGFTQAHTAIH